MTGKPPFRIDYKASYKALSFNVCQKMTLNYSIFGPSFPGVPVTKLNGCDRRKQNGSTTLHNTNLNDRVKRRKSVQNENIPKHASFL